MNGLFDAIMYAFCIKVLQGKASKDEMAFFATLAKMDFGADCYRFSNEEWNRMVRYVGEAVKKSEFPNCRSGLDDCLREANEAYRNMTDEEKKELLND